MTAYIIVLVLVTIATFVFMGVHEAQVNVKPIDKMHKPIPHFQSNGNIYPVQYWTGIIRQFDLGVRGHVWTQYYHAIRVGMCGGLLIIGGILVGGFAYECINTVISYHVPPTMFMFKMTAKELLPQYLWYFALVLAVGWLVAEPAYQYGRYKTFLDTNYQEHVNFFDVVDFHAPKLVMTAIRIALVITITILL